MTLRMGTNTLVPVGRGATGTVYRAWDEGRQRTVAIKYLHGDDPDQIRRMRREALAQGSLDHPGICKVEDFGQDERGAYIVMQYIDGAPLDRAAAELDLERRLALFVSVCEAVDHAHRRGLIHRDLKPDNILVETLPDGSLQPRIVDFGLVQSRDQTTLTLPGQIVGTLAYMAPEQARGESRLDRRADVFALGAILYELLTGTQPFEADSNSATLARVLNHDPVRPRRIDPLVPAALERVVMQALEKDPAHRYPAAGALADDLRRFLNGESVTARRRGPWWQTQRFSSRHPRVAALSAMLVVLSIAIAVYAAFNQRALQRQAEVRALAAQQLGASLRDIEWEVRAAELVPAHDLEPGLEALRRRARELVAGINEDTTGSGMSQYALGRALLALGDPAGAVAQLQAAVDAGHDGPETQLYLGLALAADWFRLRATMDRWTEPEARKTLAVALEQTRRQPAREALLRAGDQRSAHAEALLAYLSDEPIRTAGGAHEPWAYESYLLQVESLADQLDPLVIAGTGDAESLLRQARAAIDAAHRIAPSGPRVAAKACQIAYLEAAAMATGAAIEPDEALLGICRLHATLLPSDGGSHADPAHVLVKRYEALAARGDAAPALLEEGITLAQRALQSATLTTEGRWSAADALARAAWELRADTPRAMALMRTATTELERSVAEMPAHLGYRLSLGATGRKLAALEFQTGEDPTATINGAIAHLQAAAADYPEHAFVWNNLGHALKLAGNIAQRRGEDPEAHYRAAIEALEQAVAKAPGQAVAVNNLANTWSDLGQSQLGRTPAAMQALDQAAVLYQRALEVDPTYVKPLNNQANLARVVVHHLVREGDDPVGWIERGLAAVRAAIGQKPDYPFPRFNAGSMLLAQARYLANRDEPAHEPLDEARRWFDEGLALAPLLPARVERLQLELLDLRLQVEAGTGVDFEPVIANLEAVEADAAQRDDVRWARGELALLRGAADCQGEMLNEAASIASELVDDAALGAAAARMSAEATLHRCRCNLTDCDPSAVAVAVTALSGLSDDDQPLATARLLQSLQQRVAAGRN